MKKAIILFTRVPEAGRTKTRMMPELTGEECERLHICFLRDIEVQCRKIQADLFVFYTEDGRASSAWREKRKALLKIFGKEANYCPQKGDGLGERMYRAIGEVLGKGYGSCILIGSDIPEIRKNDLETAFRLLEKKDVVFGPTADGGYYLVGMKRPLSQVFSLETYGHSKVLASAIKTLESSGLTFGMVRTLSDLDTPKDLKGFRDRMRKNKYLQKTKTGSYLIRNQKISIIVPMYNEEKTIEKIQEQLRPLRKSCEIVFVDGGSTDKTLEKLDASFRVLHSEKGRAAQMNLGAKESSGEILFFLHCDSELPKKPLEQICHVMKDYRAGCFGVAFHSKNFFMFTCRVISNLRIRDRKVMFGDQGIFIDRELFFQMGMFPELPIMEDYQFSLALKSAHVRLGVAKKRIYSSDRRFPKGTLPKLALMWKMNRLRKLYRDGAPIEVISKMYQDIR